jgi:hypothetical protein
MARTSSGASASQHGAKTWWAGPGGCRGGGGHGGPKLDLATQQARACVSCSGDRLNPRHRTPLARDRVISTAGTKAKTTNRCKATAGVKHQPTPMCQASPELARAGEARCEDFLYELKAGPAGGLRPPSGPAGTWRLSGERPDPRAVGSFGFARPSRSPRGDQCQNRATIWAPDPSRDHQQTHQQPSRRPGVGTMTRSRRLGVCCTWSPMRS